MENGKINGNEEIPQLGGPHLKACHCGCDQVFFGRLNQKYFNLEHKAKINNKIRSELNKPLKDALLQIKVNYRLLERFYKESKGLPIRFSKLISLGFDLNSYFKNSKLKETGESVLRIEEFAFSISVNTEYITIYYAKK